MKNFLRDLFLLPGNNGERRLVKNFFTKKMVWTKGVESKFVENPEIDKLNKATSHKQFELTYFSPFEPIKNGRFVIDFPEIDSYIFKGCRFLGENLATPNKETTEFQVYLPIASNVDVEFYSKKSKKIGTVKIMILDPTQIVVRTIELENCYLENVSLYEEFDYKKDDIQIMTLRVSHSPRKIS